MFETKTDVDELWKRYQKKKDLTDRNALVEHYIHLVKKISFKMVQSYGKFVETDDLMSCGVMGLMDAVAKYDMEKETSFETYATYRIKGEIIDFLRRQDFLPVNVRSKIKRVESAYETIQTQTGKPATEEEVCKHLSLDKKQLRKILDDSYTYNILNLDEVLENTGLEPASDDEESMPGASLVHNELKHSLAEGIDLLSDRERLVITLYYYEELTLKEIGVVLGVSESRVSQIHSQALFQLRSKLKSFIDA